MVKTFPFKGILYNKKKLKKLDQLFTPPYDVIGPAEQDAYYEAHPFNYIRLILGKDFPGDGQYNNKYIRAAAFLDGWQRHEILLSDQKPAFYAYEQRFKFGAKKYVRLGFIGLLRLDDMGRGRVYPHEETHAQAKLDRLELMRATFANLEAIFALYNDDNNKISKTLKTFMVRRPLIEVTDQDKVCHRLWRVDHKAALAKIIKEMRERAVFIADGHHRYEAALRFKTELKTKNTKFSEEESYNHIMMYFTPLEDKGLLVLPIHRVLRNLVYFDPVRFAKELAQYFDLSHYQASKKSSAQVRARLLRDLAKRGLDKHALGLYLGQHHYSLLTLKDETTVLALMPEDKPAAWKGLDTNILHYAVLEKILNVGQEIENKVVYIKDEAEAVKLVDEGKAQAAFFLNPTRIEQIVALASKLEKMPQKSTYFYPKLLSGLVLNKIVHGGKIKL